MPETGDGEGLFPVSKTALDRVPDEAEGFYETAEDAMAAMDALRTRAEAAESRLATAQAEHAKTLETLGRRDDQLHAAEEELAEIGCRCPRCLGSGGIMDMGGGSVCPRCHGAGEIPNDEDSQIEMLESRLAALPEAFKAAFADAPVPTTWWFMAVLRWLEEQAGKEKA